MKTVEAARGKWTGILRHFGVDEQFLRNKHGECPLCGGTDRYRFDDKDGAGTYYCNACGAGDGMRLLQAVTGMDFKTAASKVDEIVGNVQAQAPKPKKDPRILLNRIHAGLQSSDGINPVRKYLHERGGLKPTAATAYHPGLDYFEDGKRVGTYPAMVHLFHAPDGQRVTYHVTYLDGYGGKAPVRAQKKVMPGVAPLNGGAIRLYPAAETMGIAEGIETAIAASQKNSVPVWATYSAGMLEQWKPPVECNRVIVFGDNDINYTGQKSAFVLANRLALEGYGVSVMIPEKAGTDWADEVNA